MLSLIMILYYTFRENQIQLNYTTLRIKLLTLLDGEEELGLVIIAIEGKKGLLTVMR